MLWGWAGDPLPDDAVEVLLHLRTELAEGRPLRARLDDLLEPAEVSRTRFRVERLLRRGVFPQPRRGGPAIPWPPF
ncbi:hypothetical protein GCM10025868_00610 [Angustibacter aerolatus]|uniref:Uncharacterized protein n=1 Tax=Angustibacter aerolatus TaxID=1162965 RepID=A0ABQ6JB59_9ACTN|nr:hypothetical protein [Angustibacter aerolatus]GMA84811.1 hypothetical protein GCM10025868_00610 [Angustibacter aerolatus]